VAGLDVVVLPSRSEGVPLALLEAMAAGRPVVATAVGGNPFALGDAGLLVPPDAPKPLAAAIARVLDDPALAAALGARARARAEARFSERAMAAAYMALYDEALDRVHGATGTGR
jgi:glycosyltransferase involved in cell wall biosynthesis